MRTSPVRIPRLLLNVTMFVGLLMVASGLHAAPQETQQQEQETALLDRVGKWKLINTGIFVLLLGWFLAKNAPRFFNARSGDIQKAIQDATGLKIEADFRYSDIDKRMASLPAEVGRIRDQAKLEMQREHERVQGQTAVEIERIQQNAGNEIDALRKDASNRVQLHTAQLALGLADKRLRDRFAQGEPDSLVGEFIDLVDRGKSR